MRIRLGWSSVLPTTVALVAGSVVGSVAGVIPAPSAHAAGVRTVAATTGFSQGHSILWGSDAQLAADLDGIAATGARWLRLDFDWPSIQAGGPDAWNWGPTDRVVDAAQARGLQILAMPAYTPTWARPPGVGDKTPPSDPDDFARFVAAAARRYAPRGIGHWEIWNEPNIEQFWAPAPDPEAYARLLVGASAAIHGVDPDAVVMNGGLAPAPDTPGAAMRPRSFLTAIYAAGAKGSLDAVAVHPYTMPFEPTMPGDWNPISSLAATHAVMTAFGDARKPIWGTETGFGTGSDSKGVSETVQAARIRQLVDAWYDHEFAGNLFVYTYRDLSASSGQTWQRMGLVRHGGTDKPALAAFESAIRRPADGSRDNRRGLCGPAAHLAPAGSDDCVDTQRVARLVYARLRWPGAGTAG